MKGKVLALTLLLGTTAFSLPLINVEASVGYASHDPSGYLQYKGDRADLEDTFGLDKESKPFARLKLEIPIVPNLYLQYMPMEFSGTRTTNVRYGDVQFSGSIDTNVKLDRYDIGLYYNIPIGWVTSLGTLGTLSVDPEIGINVRVINFEGTVTGQAIVGSTTTTETVSKDATVPVPMGYLGLGVKTPFVSLLGELRYISYSSNRYYDYILEARVSPFPVVFLGVGYRYENLKLEDVNDIYADIKVKSLYATVGVSF